MVRGNGSVRLFQERENENIDVAAIPGAAKGRIILLNASNREHPSISAASSRFLGIDSKNPSRSHVESGISNAMNGMMRPATVSYSPHLFHMI